MNPVQPARESTKQIPGAGELRNVLCALAERRSLAPVAIQAGLIGGFANVELFPEERPAIATAAPRRLATFRAGRGCARAALRELGSPEIAIPSAPSGAPVWPAGFVGSIAHTNEIAAAVVAPSSAVRGLGLDVETSDPLDSVGMLQLVCRPDELIAAHDASTGENLQRGKLIFAIKEAVYKLYSPLTGAFLEFHDLAVSLDEPAGMFLAHLADPQRPPVANARSITGVFARAGGLIVALASIP